MALEKIKNDVLNRAALEGANLKCADLRGVNLEGANLSGADLSGADLIYADLRGVNLEGADLIYADLRGADMIYADLRGADLRCANLKGADLRCADLRDACLRGADLEGADLEGAKNVPYVPMTCPDTGSFIAWKKANGYIVKLLIPEDAVRSSATGRKCRANKAMVLSIENLDGSVSDLTKVSSNYNTTFMYEIGKTVVVNDFDDNRFNECAPGIHFFINRQEAVDY